MRVLAVDNNFDKVSWETLFKKTFDLLSENLSDESFKRYDIGRLKFTGGFLLSQYEVVAYGVGNNLKNSNPVIDIREKAASIWSDKRYTEWSGSGITATRRLPRILPFGREVFNGSN